MGDLEKTLARRFAEVNKHCARLADANAPLRDKRLGILDKDSGRHASVRRELRATHKPLARRGISIPKALQPKRGPGVFVGRNGGTRVLPFDYSWTWSSKGGSAPQDAIDLGADPTSGNIWINLNTGHNAGGVIARAAVGIFFRLPVWSLANFSLFSNPTVRFHWQQSGFVFSDGFVGLLAVGYYWTGSFSTIGSRSTTHRGRILVDQMISLWCGNPGDDWGGSGDSSFPLSANFLVDSDHWYVFWVWCASSGIPVNSGASAMSDLWVYVPSISWQFDGLQPLPQPLPALP